MNQSHYSILLSFLPVWWIRIRIIWPDLDPHRAGENGSGMDPGSIKGSQNKGDTFFSRKLTEIVHQELDPNPDPFFPMRNRIRINMMLIHNTASFLYQISNS